VDMINNLKKIRERKRMSVIKLSKATGIARDLIYKMEKGEIGISKKNIPLLESALNVSISEIYGGSSNMIPIRYYDVDASAGNGCYVDSENFEVINIDENQLLRMGIRSSFEDISIINARGDSMAPIIKDRDLLFVNNAKKELFNRKIYAINEKGFLKVKRVLIKSPMDKKVTIKSDNEVDGEYPPYEIEIDGSENIICGQVIFYCRSIE
jgi:phage repressor protein C with HTH and peptisase S24 domain